MKTHQVNFKVNLKGQLAKDGSEVRVFTSIILEVNSTTDRISSIIWPTLSEINSIRSKEDKLGQLQSHYTISTVQKAYDKAKGIIR